MKKAHWFLLSVNSTGPGYLVNQEIYIGNEELKVTVAQIEHAKKQHPHLKDPVCMSVSYLGHMTQEEFKG